MLKNDNFESTKLLNLKGKAKFKKKLAINFADMV